MQMESNTARRIMQIIYIQSRVGVSIQAYRPPLLMSLVRAPLILEARGTRTISINYHQILTRFSGAR